MSRMHLAGTPSATARAGTAVAERLLLADNSGGDIGSAPSETTLLRALDVLVGTASAAYDIMSTTSPSVGGLRESADTPIGQMDDPLNPDLHCSKAEAIVRCRVGLGYALYEMLGYQSGSIW